MGATQVARHEAIERQSAEDHRDVASLHSP